MSEIPADLIAALADKYAPTRVIGRGGMATVYLAKDSRHNREVAVKVLKSELAASLGTDRFLREIEIVAQLNHPHILPLLDSGDAGVSDERGVPRSLLFYVMPFVEGESLRGMLEREGKLRAASALQIVKEVADAVGYAHRKGVVHRDLKPENILFSDGHAVVADFGIAKAITTAETTNLTRTGFPIGTPGYMSPEQAAGRADLDERSDVFSLACVCYEMLIGEVPGMWVTEDDTRMLRFMDAPPHQREALDRLPGSVEQVLVTAMALRSKHRFESPKQFADALRDAVSGKAPRIPEAEARAIVHRAADIQASSPTADGSYSLAGVQRLGAEVDIPPEQVRDAARAMARPSTKRDKPPALPANVEMQAVFDGEIVEADFEEVLEEIRMAMAEVGRLNPTLGKSISWNSLSYQNSIESLGRLTHVMVTPKDGKTRVRITESRGNHRVVFWALLAAAGITSVVASETLIDVGLLAAVPATMAAMVGGSYFGMRAWYKRFLRKRHGLFNGLMDRISRHAKPQSQPQLEDPERATPTA